MTQEGRRVVTYEQTQKVKHFVRVDPPAVGFVPGGLMPLFLLMLLVVYAVTVFARGSVEDVVGQQVRAALDREGLSRVSVEASGQNVVLDGPPLSAADAERALLVAERATCPTWLGERDCTIDVRGAFATDVTRTPPTGAVPGAEPATSCNRGFAEALARSRIEFGNASASVPPASRPLIEEIAAIAARCPGRLVVEGHTDDHGTDEANLQLSRARADEVCEAIAAEGVARERLVAEGLGETRPIATNDTAEGRARNRRIEIRVVGEP